MKQFRYLVLLAILVCIVWTGQDIAVTLAAKTALADGPSPYFIAQDALFLYVWVPLVTLSASALLVAPGLLLALGIAAPDDRFEHWLLKGFTFSLFGVPAAAAAVQAISGLPLVGTAFILLIVLLCLPGIALLANRPVPNILQGRGWDVAGMILLPLLVLLLMAPKFYWEALNDDGAHSFLNATLFIARGLPFWPPESGPLGGYPTPKMMAEVFLQTGFMRVFGPSEAAIRFAYLPGVSILLGVMLAFVRSPNDRTDIWSVFGLSAALLLFSFVMAFNPSYNPYFADIALPMTREPLIVLGVLGFILFFSENRFGWMAVVSTLALFTSPNGVLLIGFFLMAYLLLNRFQPIRQVIGAGLITLGIVALSSLIALLLERAGLTGSASEFSTGAILRRLRFVTIFDTQRILFWLLPCGILPGLTLLAWRWQDTLSRTLTLMTVTYVLFFYVQAYRILPHHFAPAVLLPLIVFWRLRPVQAAPAPGFAMALAGLAVSTWISWPETLRPFSVTRDLGHRIAIETEADPFFDLDEIRITPELIRGAFPPAWSEDKLQDQYVAGSVSVYVHARMPTPADIEANYFVRMASDPLVAGETQLGDPVEGRVLVTDRLSVYEADIQKTDAPISIAQAYRVPFDRIFGREVPAAPRQIWDVAKIVGLR
ncbi:hypothetical protein [Ruegeria arenilitoris]|uniref:hypothetical protein n=1 Tax=Ruegeria arenilitoris TaxID=1173585 RepID=UPI0014803DFA|nr:hypothetical protein [Ruegeria arenilitoris]